MNVETSPSVKLVNLARARKDCSCRHVSEINSSDVNELVAVKGLLRQVNAEMNKVKTLYSINLN